MYLPKVREIKEALNSFFTKPYTTKFPAVAYKAPVQFRGYPKYYKEYCVGCGTCAQVCPPAAIKIVDDKNTLTRTLCIDYCSCINCGQCEEKCITQKGIKLSNNYSMAVTSTTAPEVFETLEKEIVYCEICGEIIACRDHLLWIKERLGAKAFAHPNFLLEMQRQFFDSETSVSKSKIRREDYIKEVCPKCRHTVVVADEF
ncbi:MAG: 4Fe-4S binding protein [Ignavibacteriales bacterium]|nr:4Fe-4S binding protein [Ignavibacteriales bacterium]